MLQFEEAGGSEARLRRGFTQPTTSRMMTRLMMNWIIVITTANLLQLYACIAKQINNDEEYDQTDDLSCFVKHISDDNDGNDEATFDRRESDAP